MLSIVGYQIIETLFLGIRTAVYRGYQKNTGKPVIIKVARSSESNLSEFDRKEALQARLEQQYQIACSLDCESIVKAYGLEKYDRGLALILEDFGGRSLRQFLESRPLSLEEFLRIAIVLVEGLETLHQIPIVHKDINPSNIIINPDTGQVKLTDFGIASRLSVDNFISDKNNLLVGTLAYVSPEQTGRTNRLVDYRTDFYSLGVTFYEMLTGRLPFAATEPLELIYAHLTEVPVSPHVLNCIPPILSDLVMKLLAKNAEERYQTAAGIKSDLENCLRQFQTTGTLADFTLGRYDKGHQLSLAQKLYGRESAIETLLAALDRVTFPANPIASLEIMLVSGTAGMGKTSLVREIRQPIVDRGGYFCTVEFARSSSNIPYDAIYRAFSGLMRQFLTESSSQIAIWREKLLLTFGDDLASIITLIPEIGAIVGDSYQKSQDGVITESVESHCDRSCLLRRLFTVCCQLQKPLVLFLENIQRSDSSCLQLCRDLALENYQSLLIIYSYRDKDVESSLTIDETIDLLQPQGIPLTHIVLQPLTIVDIERLLSDTFELEVIEKINMLAELVFHKTQGNPLFVDRFLKILHAEKLVFYTSANNEWSWHLEKIETIGITDSEIVESIAKNIFKLPTETQKLLQLASCLGDRFSLKVLTAISRFSARKVELYLKKAILTGSILPLDDGDWSVKIEPSSNSPQKSYKFLHERIQQAAYSLTPEIKKAKLHLTIGRLLRQFLTKEEQQNYISILANQFNFGSYLLNDTQEKYDAIELNLMAAKKAKIAGDRVNNRKYLYLAMAMLDVDSWETSYDLTAAIYLETAQAEFVNANYNRLHEKLAIVILNNVRDLLDRVEIYELKILAYIAQNKMQLAIDWGLQVLEILEVHLEEDTPKIVNIEKIFNLPEMTDPLQLAKLRILSHISNAAYITDYVLLLKVVFAMVNLCLKYGNSAFASYTYIYYGVLLCDVVGNIDTGYRLGQIGISLLDLYREPQIKARVTCVFNACLRHWKEPLKKTIEPLKNTIELGIESGDLEIGGYSIIGYCSNLLYLGESLDSIEQKCQKYISVLRQFKLQYFLYYMQITHQFALNLLDRSPDKLMLVGEAFNEIEMFPVLTALNNQTSLAHAHINKGILAYIFRDTELAISHLQEVKKYKQETGKISIYQANFYYSLALLARYTYVSPQQQSEFLYRVELNQKEMKNWAYHAPDNFQCDCDLIEAEKARVLGQHDRAIELYNQSIRSVQKINNPQKEAIINELIGEFYLSFHQDKIARIYLANAYSNYKSWGAIAKVKHLEKKYPQFLCEIGTRKIGNNDADSLDSLTKSWSTPALDLASVLQASQTISEEIIFDRLLEKLLKIILENSGAQKGFLCLKKNDILEVVAVASSRGKRIVKTSSVNTNKIRFLPRSTLDYVARTKKYIVLPDSNDRTLFINDPYYQTRKTKSVLCAPIVKQNNLIGVIYLENNLITDAFTPDRVEIATLLCTQAAISLENAKLYQDLQQSKAIERAARQMSKALDKEKELNELKSRFISITSHEFRTPLATIMGSNELLERYGSKWEEDKKQIHYDRITSAVKRMNRLLEDVLLLGKNDAGKIELKPVPTNLILFCQTIFQEISLGIDRDKDKYELVFSANHEEFEANLDENLLRHILNNLLVNAIKYSPNGGRIDFKLICASHKVIFKIEDRGVGIPDADREHLFEFFHRSQNVGQIPGTGLGLAIVKKLVDLHGGTIVVDSVVDRGSIFTVTIPY
jgi:predicted ATPase/signal transduction histidine kinase/tRNA A-37 threonylcarbamoyl transferase component Bud32